MSRILKNLYNNLVEPVLILDDKGDKLYQNKAFCKIFGKIDEKNWRGALKKIEYKFQFDVCILESDAITSYTPILNALNCLYDYSCYSIYQKNEKEFLHFIIKSIKVKNWKIIYFYEITKELQFEKLISENRQLKIQNQEFSSNLPKAQNQAVKMALLNRITTSIRQAQDIKNLVETALSELSILSGANKLCYAKINGNNIDVEYIFPKKSKCELSLKLNAENKKELEEGNNLVDIVLNEHNIPSARIIMPVLNRNLLTALIVIFTSQKTINEDERELLKSIAMQISSAVLQVSLFEEIRDKKEKIEKTLVELKETQLQLINSEKMASLGQLIASVAHEINTPLASISANNEIMKKLFEETNNTMLDEINQIDKEAIKRITNIVQSLKRFVRLDEENQQEADINNELDLTLSLLKQRTKKNINIIKKYSQIPLISCFPNMLNQVFLNIIMNAIQAIEKKGAGGEITIETKLNDTNLVIEISDDGCGIDENDKRKIFQAGFTTKKVGEGTGLGLAICKKIIKEHKGNISFSSKKNSGTTFKIEIPFV